MFELSLQNRVFFWIIFMSLIGFHLATLGRVPAIPASDDGAYAAAAFQFWHTGHPGIPGFKNVLDLQHDVFVFGRTAAALQGIFIGFFGVSLFKGLLPSFLGGIWLLGATYALGRALWDKILAIVATLILGLSGIFFIATHSARPDLLLACYWITALYLVSSVEPGKWSVRFLWAGLLMGFSGDVHLNGFLLAPIPLLFWFFYRRENLRRRILGGTTYLIAVGVGVVFWFVIHYWPNPEAFLQQIKFFGGQTHGIRIVNLGFLGAFHEEIQRHLAWFWEARFHRHLLEGLLIFGCGGWMLGRGDRKDRALVIAWLAIFALAVLFMANPFGCYLIYSWPIFSLWMARGLFALAQSWGRRWAFVLLWLLIAGYLMNLVLWTGKALTGPSYEQISRLLRSAIPAQASVAAGGEWWFALGDRDFTDAQYMHFQDFGSNAKEENSISGWEKGWKNHRWQFVVAHGDIQLMLDPKVSLAEAIALMRRSKADEIREARSFSLRRCQPWLRIPAGSTPVLIFKIE